MFAHPRYEYTATLHRSYNRAPEYFMTARTFAQNGSFSLIVMTSIYNLDLVFPRFNTIQVFVDNNFDLDQF